MYLLDEYVATRPGEPFRLFPFGKVIKGGKEHLITPEIAALFRLPHFKPAIKLGSHDDVTPAGGHIIGLETRSDGLYAIPEYNENGILALERGAYRYHSPEVVWADGWMEDPETGDRIEGPLIVGTALLHMPHLGEAAALYTVEIQEGEKMTDSVEVPKGLVDKFMAWLDRKTEEPAPAPPVDPAPEVEAFEALKVKHDNLAAEIATLKAEGEKRAKLDQFSALLKDTALADDKGVVSEEAPAMLAAMTEEQSAWVVDQFKALSARIDTSALFGEIGKPGGDETGDPESLFKAAVEDCMKANPDLTYNESVVRVGDEKPELWASYLKRGN